MMNARHTVDDAVVAQNAGQRQANRGGWVPCDLAGPLGWASALEELQANGAPLPPALAALDLRMWQHRILAPGSREELPSRRELAKRWGWQSEKRVRLLLKREDEWGDPRLAEQWAEHLGRKQDASRTQAGRKQDAAGCGQTPDNAETGRKQDASRTQAGRTEGHTRVDPQAPSPSPSQEKNSHTFEQQATQEEHKEQPDNSLPGWTRVKGYGRHEVLAAVVHAIEQITQRTCNPHRCQTDAKHVLALQKATNTPWPELSRQVEQVAEWARDSNDPLAARDIRAEGWDNGTDRSRSVSTLCVQSRWADRLRAAEEWHTPPVPVPRPVYDERPPPKLPSLRAAWEERRRQQGAE